MHISRTILPELEKHLFKNEHKKRVIVIYGPRQVGKTTLAQHILEKYPDKAEYYNCDFLETREIFSYKNSAQLASVVKNMKLLILDEAQRIENIGMLLKILVDQHPHVQVIATGSSSFDLANKINEPLTGRKYVFHLFPLSFGELFSHKNIIEQRSALPKLLRLGSYPDVFFANDRDAQKNLKEITSSYLFKDIFTFQDLRKPEILTKLLRLLAFQIGSEVSYQELAGQLGVDHSVVQRYIFLLEEAFVIFRLSAFSRNLRNEIKKSRKIYFWDLGIRNTLIENYNALEIRNDQGFLWENFCIAERQKYLMNTGQSANTYFWRTYEQQEIDYIEESGGILNAFEFKWGEAKKIKPPKKFIEAYPESNFSVITPQNFSSFVL